MANGLLYAGSEDGNVYTLNATMGGLVWSFATGREVHSSSAVANGMVFVGSDGSNVYAFGLIAGTGAEKAHEPPWPENSAAQFQSEAVAAIFRGHVAAGV